MSDSQTVSGSLGISEHQTTTRLLPLSPEPPRYTYMPGIAVKRPVNFQYPLLTGAVDRKTVELWEGGDAPSPPASETRHESEPMDISDGASLVSDEEGMQRLLARKRPSFNINRGYPSSVMKDYETFMGTTLPTEQRSYSVPLPGDLIITETSDLDLARLASPGPEGLRNGLTKGQVKASNEDTCSIICRVT